MKPYKFPKTIVLTGLSFLVLGCEGFKFISVENHSKSDITIVTHPGIETPELVEYPNIYRSRFDTVLILPPDSNLLLPTYFGPLYIFNEKIKPEEIKFDYFKIISKSDTIAAKNKAEVFKLLKRKGNIGKIKVW